MGEPPRKVDPEYVKTVRRLSDLIRTLEAADLSKPEVGQWLDRVVNLATIPTLVQHLGDPKATSPLVQQVCRVLIMLLRLAEQPRASEHFRGKMVDAVAEGGALATEVGRALQALAGDVDASVSLLTVSGTAMRQPGSGFDVLAYCTRALELLASGEHSEALCNFLVGFAVRTTHAEVFEVLTKHPHSSVFGEVLAQSLNQPLGMKESETLGQDAPVERAQVLATLLGEAPDFLYKNDLRVVLEVLQREFPSCARQGGALAEAYLDCVDSVLAACDGALPFDEALDAFEEVARDELVPGDLRGRLELTLRRHRR